jgi:DNA-binding GntR family transcriptional regulator
MKVHSIVDAAAKRLEDMIVKGKLKPGQKIKELELAERLGISRPPLREAFKILEADGLVRREPRRGVFVAEICEADVWEIYTLKIALYTLAVRLAIEADGAGGIEKLARIVGQMEALVAGRREPDIIRYEELNGLFHETTAAIAGHGRLRKLMQSLNRQVKRMAYRSLGDRGRLEESCRYHREILTAIARRDLARAERLTREHVLKGLAAQMLRRAAPPRDANPPIRTQEAAHAAPRS